MLEEIRSYEQQAKLLEPDASQRKVLRDAVVGYTEKFLEEIKDLETLPAFQMKDTGVNLLKAPISDEPMALEKILKFIDENVDKEGLNPASGGDLGYIPGGGIYTSSLGDYWAAITNRYAGIFFANPGAVRMENQLIKWMKNLAGYPTAALGNLASGGSIANLIAIVTARDAHQIKSADVPRQVIYLSKQAHHSIDKAINIAGLRECHVRVIDVNEHYKLDVTHLQSSIDADIKEGLQPWLIIGSAGTTNTGAVDPLDKMADIADHYELWFHVDAAYGGFFLLTEHGKEKFKGIERSDSVVMDPHKGLFLPYGLGVVLIRSGSALRKSFAYHANYMQDTVDLIDEISPAEVSPELSKHFRGLRMWLPLMVHGVSPFRAALEEKLLLTQYTYQKLQEMDHVKTGPEPDLSVVTFRFAPPNLDADTLNKEIIKEIHDDGRVFLSSTTIDGLFIIRFAILSFRTHLKEIDVALKILREKFDVVSERLGKEGSV